MSYGHCSRTNQKTKAIKTPKKEAANVAKNKAMNRFRTYAQIGSGKQAKKTEWSTIFCTARLNNLMSVCGKKSKSQATDTYNC